MIIGSSTSRFVIQSGAPIDLVIDLPLTNSQGLIETYVVRQIKRELISLNIENNPIISRKQKIYGEDITWTFNYGDWVIDETLMNMQDIYINAKAGYNIRLFPRFGSDENRYFDVYYSGEPFDVGVLKGGDSADNRLPIFRFESKKTETSRKWSVIVPASSLLYTIGDDSFDQILYEI